MLLVILLYYTLFPLTSSLYICYLIQLPYRAARQHAHRPNICCPRDCVSRHNGGTSGAPLKPLRDDRALRALSTLRGLRGAPEVPQLCRETSVSRTANVGTVGMNGLKDPLQSLEHHATALEQHGILNLDPIRPIAPRTADVNYNLFY